MARGTTGLVAATDGYQYYDYQGSAYVTLMVLNNAVDVGFGTMTSAYGPEAAQYGAADEYIPPGTLIRPDRFDAIRIKNHVPGQVAQFSIATRLVEDIPQGVPLGASFTPSYLVIDPVTGVVSATFSGHVKASGVDLPVGPAPNVYSQPSAITWLESAGARIAWISSGEGSGPTNELGIYTQNSPANPLESIAIQALDQNASQGNAGVLFSAGSNSPIGVANALVRVLAGPNFRDLLRQNGSSDYVQKTDNPPYFYGMGSKFLQVGYSPTVTTDGGGWANYALPSAFPNTFDGVIAVTSADGSNPNYIQNVNVSSHQLGWGGAYNPPNPLQQWRAFIGTAGVGIACFFVAWGT